MKNRNTESEIAKTLIRDGFQFGMNSGPRGEMGYTNTFSHAGSMEILWVTVNLIRNKVHFYNEYDCGGMLSSSTIEIPKFDSAEDFFEWLTNEIEMEKSQIELNETEKDLL